MNQKLDEMSEQQSQKAFVETGNSGLPGTFPCVWDKVLPNPERKSFSVIALNLESVEDVDAVIKQCEAIKKKIVDG